MYLLFLTYDDNTGMVKTKNTVFCIGFKKSFFL